MSKKNNRASLERIRRKLDLYGRPGKVTKSEPRSIRGFIEEVVRRDEPYNALRKRAREEHRGEGGDGKVKRSMTLKNLFSWLVYGGYEIGSNEVADLMIGIYWIAIEKVLGTDTETWEGLFGDDIIPDNILKVLGINEEVVREWGTGVPGK